MDINKPINKKCNIKINLYAYDDSGQIVQMYLHTEEDYSSETNIFLNYLDSLIEGEVVMDKIKKAIKEDHNIDRMLDIQVVAIEEDKLYDSQDLEYDFIINIEVPYSEKYNKKIGDIYTSWLPLTE